MQCHDVLTSVGSRLLSGMESGSDKLFAGANQVRRFGRQLETCLNVYLLLLLSEDLKLVYLS